MTKKNDNHPLAVVFYQLGKDIGDINRRLTAIEQHAPQANEPQSTQGSEQIREINTVLEAVQQYVGYAKANAGIQQSFERFLSSNVQDYELTDEQRRTLYHAMCQHVWEVHFDHQNPNALAELPIPQEFQGKFAYVVKPKPGYTEITYELLSTSHECELAVDALHNPKTGEIEIKPAYAYLVIPDLVAMRKPQVIGI